MGGLEAVLSNLEGLKRVVSEEMDYMVRAIYYIYSDDSLDIEFRRAVVARLLRIYLALFEVGSLVDNAVSEVSAGVG